MDVTIPGQIREHDISSDSHKDIRKSINDKTDKLGQDMRDAVDTVSAALTSHNRDSNAHKELIDAVKQDVSRNTGQIANLRNDLSNEAGERHEEIAGHNSDRSAHLDIRQDVERERSRAMSAEAELDDRATATNDALSQFKTSAETRIGNVEKATTDSASAIGELKDDFLELADYEGGVIIKNFSGYQTVDCVPLNNGKWYKYKNTKSYIIPIPAGMDKCTIVANNEYGSAISIVKSVNNIVSGANIDYATGMKYEGLQIGESRVISIANDATHLIVVAITSNDYNFTPSLMCIGNPRSAIDRLEDEISKKIDKGAIIEPRFLSKKAGLNDCDFVEIFDKKRAKYVSTTEKTYEIVDDDLTYLVRFDLEKINTKNIILHGKNITTIRTNLCVLAVDNLYYNVISNGTNAYAGVTLEEDTHIITIVPYTGKDSYKNSKYLYITLAYNDEIEFSIEDYPVTSRGWLKVNDVETERIINQTIDNSVEIIIPSKIYTAVGHEMNLYYKNIIQSDNIDRYALVWTLNNLATISRSLNECLRITPTRSMSNTQNSLTIIDKLTNRIIKNKKFTTVISEERILSKKVIFIGDSLTDKCIFPAEIIANLSSNAIESVGTIIDTVDINGLRITVKNEGRGGWSAPTYCYYDSYNGKTNAFWNPSTGKFDFSYYMNHNGFNSVDCVVITLGTNDIAGLTNTDFNRIINSYKTIIDSIHRYNSSIKIIISMTTPCADNDGWGMGASGNGTSANQFTYYQKELLKHLISNFDETMPNVYLAPTYANLDTNHDFPMEEVSVSARNPYKVIRAKDNVHPSDYGYFKMADAIWYTMLAVL